jgi:hypothetical protein
MTTEPKPTKRSAVMIEVRAKSKSAAVAITLGSTADVIFDFVMCVILLFARPNWVACDNYTPDYQ